MTMIVWYNWTYGAILYFNPGFVIHRYCYLQSYDSSLCINDSVLFSLFPVYPIQISQSFHWIWLKEPVLCFVFPYWEVYLLIKYYFHLCFEFFI